MSRTLAFCLCMLSVTTVCFAQFNRTESVSFTTYYPAPYGVYKNVRLTPSVKPDKTELNQAGTMYFNDSEFKPYIHNGTEFVKIGSGSNLYYGYGVSPYQCSGTISTETFNNQQLCSGPWYMDVNFTVPFTNKVHVIVTLLSTPDNAFSPCAHNVTDRYIGYPSNITSTGFRLWASGSPLSYNETSRVTCYTNSANKFYDSWYTRAVASWFAISE
ncbi:MAG: hypothetical protein NTY14_00425 [Candidatus Omnitrophica bacterium]|nr:hypothetical protein [Candidatus Omnitrophota bacterium]